MRNLLKNRTYRWVGIVVAFLVATTATTQTAYAIFGFGDVVFDPTSYVELGTIATNGAGTWTQTLAMTEQLVAMYQDAEKMYTLATALAQSFNGPRKAEWFTIAQAAVTDYTADKYGENKGWSEAMNGDPSQVPAAWKAATLGLQVGSSYATHNVGSSNALSTLATIEAIDGSSQKCLATISQYRSNSLANQLGPILKLAIARMDGTSDTNSNIQQLNIIAAQHEQGNKESLAQGTVNTCLVEQQILANKAQRDTQVEALNAYARAADLQQNNPSSQNNGLVVTIQNYIPR